MARGSLFTVKLWVSNHEVVPQAECCSSGCGHSTGNLAKLKPLKSAGWVAVLKDCDPKMYTMNIPISILFRTRLLVRQTSLVSKKSTKKQCNSIPISIKHAPFQQQKHRLCGAENSTRFFLGQRDDLEVV